MTSVLFVFCFLDWNNGNIIGHSNRDVVLGVRIKDYVI